MRRQRNMAQMKEQNRSTEKRTKRNRDNQPIICRNQTLVIRMLKELIEYSNNIKEAMKVALSDIKKKGTVKGRKLGFKSTIWTTRRK